MYVVNRYDVKKKKWILKAVLTAGVWLAGMCALPLSLTAYAAPQVMADGTVFDAEYYAETYPDVAEAYGMDEQMLYEHYKLYGQAEGRAAVAMETEVAELAKAQEYAALSTAHAAQVSELVNAERRKAGVSELTYDLKLSDIAARRAQELSGLFSHMRPDGTTTVQYLTEERNARYAGENIAMGQAQAGYVMEDWMNSKSHRNNILNQKYTRIGVGYYRNEDGKSFWCQLFCSDYDWY